MAAGRRLSRAGLSATTPQQCLGGWRRRRWLSIPYCRSESRVTNQLPLNRDELPRNGMQPQPLHVAENPFAQWHFTVNCYGSSHLPQERVFLNLQCWTNPAAIKQSTYRRRRNGFSCLHSNCSLDQPNRGSTGGRRYDYRNLSVRGPDLLPHFARRAYRTALQDQPYA